MCIEFLSGDGDAHPMTKVSKVIFDYLSNSEPTEDGLRDYLADEYAAKRIQKCGCGDKDFKLTKTETGYQVVMGSVNGMVYHISITDTEYSFELVPISKAIDGYYDMIYNEYKE